MDLPVGTDDKGFVHILLYPDHDWRHCDWYKTADPDAPLGDRLCYACRELPGRERHARKVLGCTGPSWEAMGLP